MWGLAVVGAVLVATLTGERYLAWIPAVMTLCLLASFGIQLGLGRSPGLVTRLGGSAIGAFAVLLVTTGVLLWVRPEGGLVLG